MEPDPPPPDVPEGRGLITGLGIVYLTVGMVVLLFLGIFVVSYLTLMP